MVNPRQPAKRLGELLIQKGLLSPGQLEQALQQQRASGEFLGLILVRMRFVDDETLLAMLSEQFGIPRERVSPEQVDWRLVQQFPISALSEGMCFPIRADAESVTVAIANPLNAWALSAIEKSAGFRTITPVLVSEEELQHLRRALQERALRRLEAHFKDKDHGRTQAD